MTNNTDPDKNMNTSNIPDSILLPKNLDTSNEEQSNPQQEGQKSRRTFLILAAVLLIGLIAALVVGGIGVGGVKLPCH